MPSAPGLADGRPWAWRWRFRVDTPTFAGQRRELGFGSQVLQQRLRVSKRVLTDEALDKLEGRLGEHLGSLLHKLGHQAVPTVFSVGPQPAPHTPFRYLYRATLGMVVDSPEDGPSPCHFVRVAGQWVGERGDNAVSERRLSHSRGSSAV